jgi:tetratricopeptide (TPR) repeat protein
MDEFRYKAFISYSHKDEIWAAWLHRALESYRVPRKLVGARAGLGAVPSRIKPVFRDRDELASAADLSATVKEALAESESLIVICSPAAAASQWVREEIREFVRLGRRDRIFCIIVDGDARESGSVAAVFPDAIAEAGMHEPLAADARKWADGRRLAKLKLVSGILGLPLDQLRRLDLQKRRKRWALTAVASIPVIAIALMAVTARMAAEQRRDSGEAMVAGKMTELRIILEQAENPEDLDQLKDWAPHELAALIEAAGPAVEDLLDAALDMRSEGEALQRSGDLAAAMERFRGSWALFAEAYRRDRDDLETFFQLGQAEFWIGQVHYQLGELDSAEAAFMSYAEITRRLIQRQPENAEWVMEMAYALTNLGDIEKRRNDINPERFKARMQAALDYNRMALIIDPSYAGAELELGQSFANQADAMRYLCRLDDALSARQEGVAVETRLLERDSDDPQRQEDLAVAHTGLAWVQASRGLSDEARSHYQQAVELLEASARGGPKPRSVRLDLAERRQVIAWLDAVSGRLDEAWVAMEALEGEWQYLRESAELDDVRTLRRYSTYLLNQAWLANELGQVVLARDLLEKGFGLIAAESMRLPGNRTIGNDLTLAAFHYWDITGELPGEEILGLLPDYSAYPGRTQACLDASLAVRKAVMLGDPSAADDLVAYLRGNGYREPGFMRICRKYYNCSGQ